MVSDRRFIYRSRFSAASFPAPQLDEGDIASAMPYGFRHGP